MNIGGFIEAQHRAWHSFREEHGKGRSAAPEVLFRIEGELLQHEDANQRFMRTGRYERESPAEQIARLLGRIGLGNDVEDRDVRERKESFFTWARYGLPESWDPRGLRQDDIETKWQRARGERGLRIEQKVLVLSDDTGGGYLAPREYVAEIIKAQVLFSPMRDLVRVRQTSSREAFVPKRTGVAAAAWTGETQTRTESQNPTYGGVEIPVHEMTAEVYLSYATLEDSAFDLESELREEFSEQFSVSEGLSVVSGNGVGKPLGFLDASQNIATTNSGSATTIADATGQANGIITLQHAVKTAYAQRGTWVLNRQTLGSVRKLQDAQKQYIWQPSPALGMPSAILGAPYMEVPDMPSEAAGTKPIAFGDWKRAYTLVDRISMSMLRDPYTKANAGQVKFLARRRVGGQVVLAEAVRTLTCSV